MTKETISGKLDAVKLVKEISREKFQSLPKERLIGDKRRKEPRYGHQVED
jgi:hypothetical protein